jgi:RNA polymerase sigma factor for flagellar operon FliA
MPKQNAEALAVFEQHRPLAERLARSYRRRFHGNTLPEEVSAAAFVGLWQAALSKPRLPFDEFEAFASVRIRGAILDEIRAHDPLPRRARKNLGQIVMLSIEATQGTGNSNSEENRLLAQFAVDSDVEENLFIKERLALVAPAIAQLRRRERDILARLMRRSPVEVSRDLGISEARVSQIWSRIVGKLQGDLGLAPARLLAKRDWRALRKK